MKSFHMIETNKYYKANPKHAGAPAFRDVRPNHNKRRESFNRSVSNSETLDKPLTDNRYTSRTQHETNETETLRSFVSACMCGLINWPSATR